MARKQFALRVEEEKNIEQGMKKDEGRDKAQGGNNSYRYAASLSP
jgi:hypothetical protein